MAFLDFLGFGGGSEEESFKLPEYYLSEYYEKPQEKLSGIYGGVLSGELDPYYAPIGEFGGNVFDKLMRDITGRVTTDVSRAVDEDLVRRGVARGGLGAATKSMAVAEKVGDIEAALGLEDYTRALSARGDLLSIGLRGLEGVRTAGLTESELRNMFNLQLSNIYSKEEEDTSDIFGDIAELATKTDWGKMFGSY